MKKVRLILTVLVFLPAVVFSVLYAFLSYVFTDMAIVQLINQSKPWISKAVTNWQISYSIAQVNAVGLLLLLFLSMSMLLVIFYFDQIKDFKKSMIWLALIPISLSLAYPIVSRDIFSYLFYAKTLWLYHQNPYLYPPETFKQIDLWLGFMHNIERVYVYGPVALLINLFPMALIGSQSFLANYFGYKILCLIVFLFGAWLLQKLVKNQGIVLVLWILNPFVLNEFLINSHNDLWMIVFFWWAIYLIKQKHYLKSFLVYALSVMVKYASAPFGLVFLVPQKYKELTAIVLISLIVLYLNIFGGLTWYNSWVFFLLPYLKMNKVRLLFLSLFFVSLTLGYSGFLEHGRWAMDSSNVLIDYFSKFPWIFFVIFAGDILLEQKKLLVKAK